MQAIRFKLKHGRNCLCAITQGHGAKEKQRLQAQRARNSKLRADPEWQNSRLRRDAAKSWRQNHWNSKLCSPVKMSNAISAAWRTLTECHKESKSGGKSNEARAQSRHVSSRGVTTNSCPCSCCSYPSRLCHLCHLCRPSHLCRLCRLSHPSRLWTPTWRRRASWHPY